MKKSDVSDWCGIIGMLLVIAIILGGSIFYGMVKLAALCKYVFG